MRAPRPSRWAVLVIAAVIAVLLSIVSVAWLETGGFQSSTRTRVNGRIVFQSDRVGGTGSFAIDPESGGLWTLRSGVADDEVSPDATHALDQIQFTEGAVYEHSWSPDGERIVFRCGEGSSNWPLCVGGLDGKAKVITSSQAESGDGDPLWSPRGDLIAFSRGYSTLFVVRPDGTDLRSVAESISIGSYAWSPDGDSLVYVAEIPDYFHKHAYIVRNDGHDQRRLWSGLVGDYGHPVWSPDGATIALVPNSRGTVVVDAADGSSTRVVPAGQDVRELVWSPDSTELAYIVAGYPKLPALWLVDVSSGRRRLVLSGSDFGGEIDSLRWEERVSKLARLAAKRLVELIPGSPTRLPRSRFPADLVAFSPSTGRVDARFPRLSPDGYINAVVADGHGGWFIGGGFTSLGGVVCFGLAHVLSDDSVDRRWCRRVPLRDAASPRASVDALALREGSLIVGGRFTSVGGESRSGLASIDLQTDSVSGWRPLLHQSGATPCVTSIVLRGSTAYLLGCFDRVGGKRRYRLAAVDVQTGHPTAWDPEPDQNVHGDSATAIALSEAAIYSSGYFEHIGRARRAGLAALDLSSGRALTVEAQSLQSPLLIGNSLYLPGRSELRLWSPPDPRLRYADVIALTDGAAVLTHSVGERYVLRSYDLGTGRLRLSRSPLFTSAPAVIATSDRKIVAGGDFEVVAK